MLNATPNHIKRNAIENNIIKNIRNLSRLKEKINNAITEKINRGIHILFKPDNEVYYEPVWMGNTSNNNYIKYESNGHRKKTLLIEEYFSKIRPYLSKIINDLKTQCECKIQ